MIQHVLEKLWEFYLLGGPVVGILAVLSVTALTVILFKLWAFHGARLGRKAKLEAALDAWDAGNAASAAAALTAEPSPFARVIGAAMSADQSAAASDRVDAMAEAVLADFERGFRLLDAIAQTAPLLGLFGTVLGMIEAFQAMQGAGTSVDPSVLAGGIWVALLTTAVGLAVAIPTALVLTWFEAMVARERGW
ncbi:MAG: MotA/TolQ/ExbB proton channel family protein, partial [Rhodobacteraceae bacterium]|nr:MotA/TolQ/ExbB proton channel family protein [Paracoccaceae bacterium]